MSELDANHSPRVFLLPGLGATADLFADYQFPFLNCAVDYPAPCLPDEGFADYARRLVAENGIRPGDSLIGMSLGGMLACEIARHIFIRKLTLVSSGTDSQHLRPVIRRMRPLSRVVPWKFIQRAPFPTPLLSHTRRRALAMLRAADADFLPWACLHAADFHCPVRHPDLVQIHGDRDPVFPISRQAVHHIICGGDHLMLLSHRREIEPLLIARHEARRGGEDSPGVEGNNGDRFFDKNPLTP
ncbi:MAG: alpha/beta fold hydrolase [Luteolibacter sp.]